jgi:hypothetical protein
MYFVGIDNASQGAIAIINEDMKIIDVMKYPRYNLFLMHEFLYPYKQKAGIKNNCFAVLERPFLARNRINSTIVSYEIFGTHRMNLECLKIPYELAEPRLNMKTCWRKEFNFKSKKTEDLKKESIGIVDLIFDGRADKWIRLPKKGRRVIEYCKPDHDIAEALLLAVYAMRVYEVRDEKV